MLKPGVSSRLSLFFPTQRRPGRLKSTSCGQFLLRRNRWLRCRRRRARNAAWRRSGAWPKPGSLARMAMPDQGKVAEIGCFVNFHALSPSAGFREEVLQPGRDEDRTGAPADPILVRWVEVQASPTLPAKLPILTQAFGRQQGTGVSAINRINCGIFMVSKVTSKPARQPERLAAGR